MLLDRFADRVEYAEDGSATLTLRKPLKAEGGEVAFLTLRRPTYGDLLAQDKQPGDDIDRTAWLIFSLSGVATSVTDTIDAQDGLILSDIVAGFFDRLPDGTVRREGDLVERHADRITWTEDGAILVLRTPLVTKDGAAAEITLRRPTFKEMRTHRGRDYATSAKLIAALSGIGPLTLAKIDALDGAILSEIVLDFLANARTSGGH